MPNSGHFSVNQSGMEMGKAREVELGGTGEAGSHAHSHAHSHSPPYQATDQADKQKKGIEDYFYFYHICTKY